MCMCMYDVGPNFDKVSSSTFGIPHFSPPQKLADPHRKKRSADLLPCSFDATACRRGLTVAQAVLAGECGSSASPIWSLSAPRTSAGPLPPVAPDAWHVQRAFRTRPAFSPLRTSAPRLRPILVCNSCCALCPLSSLIVSSPPLHLSLSPYSSATHPYPYLPQPDLLSRAPGKAIPELQQSRLHRCRRSLRHPRAGLRVRSRYRHTVPPVLVDGLTRGCSPKGALKGIPSISGRPQTPHVNPWGMPLGTATLSVLG